MWSIIVYRALPLAALKLPTTRYGTSITITNNCIQGIAACGIETMIRILLLVESTYIVYRALPLAALKLTKMAVNFDSYIVQIVYRALPLAALKLVKEKR